ncbi:hypothetical protein COMA2_220052 [Candidatus Nitrospira nitrificans]|uniref:Uncharacterized protein n=1 Tax=Candidatus Nitrospira nitrificans TaxID=1742973 RepID=A0A0S4LIE2_9BACT|nr:hypothetical protein COMA2_220052 [Candidatus Nitrospira nitrificans]
MKTVLLDVRSPSDAMADFPQALAGVHGQALGIAQGIMLSRADVDS